MQVGGTEDYILCLLLMGQQFGCCRTTTYIKPAVHVDAQCAAPERESMDSDGDRWAVRFQLFVEACNRE